jgi:transcriptional regulator with XRE-family HTH domain
MKPADFRRIRKLYGETQAQFGRRLGFDGEAKVIARRVRRYEGGEVPIVGTIAVLLVILRDLKLAPHRYKKRSFIAASVLDKEAS